MKALGLLFALGATMLAAEPLRDPADAFWKQLAPEIFRARFTTTKGEFVIEVHREWAPRGADAERGGV